MTGMTRGTRVVTGGGGGKWGEKEGDTGVRRKGTRGVRRGVPGARMSPGTPHHTRRVNCVL